MAGVSHFLTLTATMPFTPASQWPGCRIWRTIWHSSPVVFHDDEAIGHTFARTAPLRSSKPPMAAR